MLQISLYPKFFIIEAVNLNLLIWVRICETSDTTTLYKKRRGKHFEVVYFVKNFEDKWLMCKGYHFIHSKKFVIICNQRKNVFKQYQNEQWLLYTTSILSLYWTQKNLQNLFHVICTCYFLYFDKCLNTT